ncbi:hypothetical protein MRX96_004841 [Rhipicephalus microplus]
MTVSHLSPVSVRRQQDRHAVFPKRWLTSLHLERRTGVPACFKLQPLRKHPTIRRPAEEEHEGFCGNRSSETELLLRSQHRTSSVHNLRKSKITIKVPVGLLVLYVMPATLVALRPLPKRQVVLSLQRSALTWLIINFSFDNIESKSASGDGFPAVASGLMHRLKALFGFVLRESNKMANRQPGDDYDELDNI